MLGQLLAWLPRKQKSTLKTQYYRIRKRVIETLFSYGVRELISALRTLGIARGDTLMVHSGFSETTGFVGSPQVFIDALLEVIGPEGNLLMVSMPYQSSTYDYVQQGRSFDVRKSVSRMGIVSEVFRRRSNVLRSLHPTHPVLACGPKAAWLLADHDKCLHPCGVGTPFDKVAQLDGKVLFFNVSFRNFTFHHYLEERVYERIGFPLFRPQLFELPVIDVFGKRRIVSTYVYSREATQKRRPEIVQKELRRQGLFKEKRVGNSHLQLVKPQDAIRCVDNLTDAGVLFQEWRSQE
jgi:aminoglycoside 3-N-acetyltransferase